MRLDYSNKYRVLLTEVLPYEAPLVFSNFSFYRWANDCDFAYPHNFFNLNVTIPFNYKIRREGKNKSRTLSIIHPQQQLDIAEFYDNYDSRMLYVCSLSPFSIRHIDKKTSCIFYVKDDISFIENTEERCLELEENFVDKNYRSYFSYLRYDYLYKFFESGDYLRLEQKYEHLMTTDVANCFYSIYTHSIAWAVKGKENAKADKKAASFENEFDKLLQKCNYGETNGIVVGPEVARIFAEVIFQRVDIDIIKQLKERNYKLGEDYEIRRYVDDYYVYSHSTEMLKVILDVIKEKLQQYHLYISPSKTEYYNRPFVKNMAIAKNEMESMIDDYFGLFFEKDDEGNFLKAVRNPIKSWKKFAKQLRFLAKKYDVNYGDINSYGLSILNRFVKQAYDTEMKFDANLASFILYVSIHLFSLDMYATVSIKLCRIIYYVVTNAADNRAKDEIKLLLQRELKRCFDIYQRDIINDATNLEIMNILLTVNRLTDIKFPQSILLELFGLELNDNKTFEHLDYFQICTLLSIIKKENDYKEIKSELKKEIENRLDNKDSLKKSENTLLFLDILQCPHIDDNIKTGIIMKICNISNTNKAIITLDKFTKIKCWFFDWNDTRSIIEYIEKKCYRVPYN